VKRHLISAADLSRADALLMIVLDGLMTRRG